MTGITPEQFVEVLAFIQKHHKFGYVPEADLITEYSYGIKYVDATYDSRFKDIWSIAFRSMNVRFATNHFNGISQPPDDWKYESLFDLVMAFLKGEFKPDESYYMSKHPHYTSTVRLQLTPDEHEAIIQMATKKTLECIKLIEQIDAIENDPEDEVVDKKHLAIPIQAAIIDVYFDAMAGKDEHEKLIKTEE